jgi:hypothetical protein
MRTTTVRGPGPGRPRYMLDLTRACELHDLGNSWESIEEAMGVQRLTLYNHLGRAGFSTARRQFTEISYYCMGCFTPGRQKSSSSPAQIVAADIDSSVLTAGTRGSLITTITDSFRMLLDEYTAAYTSSETPFSACVSVVSRRYSIHSGGSEHPFVSAEVFRAVWFAYVKLQYLDGSMACPMQLPLCFVVKMDGCVLA